jgi:hypothetical protein
MGHLKGSSEQSQEDHLVALQEPEITFQIRRSRQSHTA